MLPNEIVRGWKDEEHRMKLSETAQSSLPDNPAGLITLTDEEIAGIEGGTWTTFATITTTFITITTCGITLCTCVIEDCGGL